MMEKPTVSQDFAKGFGVGVLAVLALGFVLQNLGGIQLSGEPKILKKTAQIQQDDTAGQPDSQEPETANIPDVTTDDYIYGNKNAKVTIVEYSDLQCPFCKQFHPTVKAVVDASNGAVNWVYRHFPLSSIHPNAQKYAEASECVGKLGGNDAFWKSLDSIYELQPQITDFSGVAKAVGVDAKKLQSCVDGGEMAGKVQQQTDDAVASGGRGTPYSVVLGQAGEAVPLSGALPQAQVQQLVDDLLK